MTKYVKCEIQCAICESKFSHNKILSTTTTDEPEQIDLDTRPWAGGEPQGFPDMMYCPECGYYSFDISQATPSIKDLVRSPVYIRQYKSTTYPMFVNQFLCRVQIDEKQGHFSDAARALLYSAWVYDDAAMKPQARICRKRAASMVSRAVRNGQKVTQRKVETVTLQVDLLRRAGLLDAAQKLIDEKSQQIQDDHILRILKFQSKLITRKDDTSYLYSKILGLVKRAESLQRPAYLKNEVAKKKKDEIMNNFTKRVFS